MQTGAVDFSHPYTYTELAHLQDTPDDAARLARLRFHLETADYFAFLATIFGILEEGLTEKSEDTEKEVALVRCIRKDLVYLQSTYHITPVSIEA